MKIIEIITVCRCILFVYHTHSNAYQYFVINNYGIVYKPDNIYYTAEAAIPKGNPPFPKEMSKLSRACEGRKTICKVYS